VTVCDVTPKGPTRHGIELAMTIPRWASAAHLDDYVEALWTAIKVHGDIDTNCAIIGGIVALAVGEDGIPVEWRRNRERLAL
jgi:ADP-ribosylglycohydrolase